MYNCHTEHSTKQFWLSSVLSSTPDKHQNSDAVYWKWGDSQNENDYFFICCKYSCATYSSIRSKPLDALQPRKQQQMIIARQLGRHDVRLGTDAHHWPQTEHVSAIWHILQPTEYICRINQGQANCPSYDKCFPPLQCWLVPLFQGLPLHLLIFLVFRLPVHIFCGPIRICSTL